MLNNKNPLFSILMANFNDGIYIDRAIDSVKKQTYSDWEIIIVDDGSTDNSHEIYKKYRGDDKIHIFFNDVNHGCGYTKHKCIELANGEICGFVDADDAITPKAIEIMVNEHINNPNASLIYSLNYICDNDLNIISTSNHQCQIPEDSTFLEYKMGCVSHFATFKKTFYKKTTGINELYLIAEDLDLYYKLEEVGKLIHIPQPLYYYRLGTSTHISLGEKKQYSIIWAFIAKIDACKRRGISMEKYAFPLIDDIVNYRTHTDVHKIINTPQYKIGQFFLLPINLLRKITSHFHKK